MMQASATRPGEHNLLNGRDFLKFHASKQSVSLLSAVLVGTLSTVFMLIQWLVFALLAQNIIVEHALLSSQSYLLIVFMGAVLSRTLLTRLQTSLSQSASLNIRHNIRESMLSYWRTASPIALKETSAGANAAQWVEEVEAMDGYFSRYWPQQMLAFISPLLILALVAYLNWLCAVLLLVSAPLIPMFMILVGMGAENLNQKYSSIRQRLAGHFLDRVANLSSIKILGAQNEVFEEVEDYSNQYRKVIMKTLKLAFLSSTVLEFFTSIAIASLAIYIGFSLYGAINWGPAASLTLYTGLLILILAPEFFQPLRNLSQYYHDRATALGAANNLVTLFNTHTNNEHENEAMLNPILAKQTSEPKHKGMLNMHNVYVAYTGSKTQTGPINVALNSGDILVVTGSSGAGKSTLLNTLAGYLPLAGGQLSFVDSASSSGDLSKSPAAIAYLPQNAWIKNDTIYNNLAALAPNASKDQMMAALHTLGLADELSIQHSGLNTLIGEHGQGLSGGQMQRIALARVLLNPAPIVLLDEPSAKLDATSKQFIIKALKILQANTILIIATHDPALIAIANFHLNLNNLKEVNNAVLV